MAATGSNIQTVEQGVKSVFNLQNFQHPLISVYISGDNSFLFKHGSLYKDNSIYFFIYNKELFKRTSTVLIYI